MRLFVVCPQDNLKIYLPFVVTSHNDLNDYTTARCPHACRGTYDFPRSGVFAEPIAAGVGGAVVGGLLGLLGGPVGLIIGALAGGALGGGAQNLDQQAADRFNSEQGVYP